ncbi:divergent PAP2 family protein [Candidatus Woesearchaeota archaeon]|nr:divergent PAP2 family protein [Candidatus Woesearchaeota archaeon]
MVNTTLYIILSALLSWLTTKFIKCYADRKLPFVNSFLSEGGVVSSHSALVVGIATSIFLVDGFSTTFALATIFALIVLHDSTSSRYAVSEHAKILNKLQKKIKLKERFGHRPKQMFYGVLIGLIVPVVLWLVL